MIRSIARTVPLLLGLFTFSSFAWAQSCTASISNLNFGTVSLLGGGTHDSSATLTINCTNSLNLSLAIRACVHLEGGNGGVSGSARTMANGAKLLNYQLYQDSARSIPWGSTSSANLGTVWGQNFLLLPLSSFSRSQTIYGRILANQNTATGGSYLSSFSGTQARVNWTTYDITPPACSTVIQNQIYPAFNVQSFVDRTCSLTSENINFGSRGLLKSQVDAAGRVSVSCTSGLPFNISLNGGLANALPTQRKMSYNGNSIIYGLYSDATRQIPWGTGAGAILSGVGTGVSQVLNVYGRVPPQATPSPGVYNDTVVVTVTF